MTRFLPTRTPVPATEQISPDLAGPCGLWTRQVGRWVLLAHCPSVAAALRGMLSHRGAGGLLTYRIERPGVTPATGAAPHVVRDVLG